MFIAVHSSVIVESNILVVLRVEEDELVGVSLEEDEVFIVTRSLTISSETTVRSATQVPTVESLDLKHSGVQIISLKA